MATVVLIGCLDTKGEEFLFLKKALQAAGARVHVIDTGIAGEPCFEPDTPASAVAEAGGTPLPELRKRADRGFAVEVMSRGAAALLRRLYERGAVDAVLGAGGSANTTIAATAMQALPTGVPKLIVSTLASGDVSPYVGTKDIAMLYSVVDIAGVNRISARILGNAARAVAAMAAGESLRPESERPLVAATMFGVTTPCVTAARKILEEAGYEVLVFHATGTGGRAMEGLIDDGYIAGVLDITTTELADEVAGGILSAGPTRLTAAGRKGIPQVVSIGAVDMVNFGPMDTVPERYRRRRLYKHNPTVTLMRTTPEENAEIGRRIAERLNAARGPVKLFLPRRGVSLYSKEGGVFYDPDADRACIEALRAALRPDIDAVEIDADINDERFARACAEALIAMLRSSKSRREPQAQSKPREETTP